MSLTFPAFITAAFLKANVEIDWIVKLFYDDEATTKFIGLSSKDRYIYDSGSAPTPPWPQYYGIVKDWGEITQSIDLKESKASIDNVSIICANTFKNGKLSDLLIYGTQKFINRKVMIYMVVGSANSLLNCALLYSGRLIGINATQEEVTLDIEQRSPFDYINIPNVRTSKGIYVPVIYGDYTGVNSVTEFSNAGIYHPLPIVEIKNRLIYVLLHQSSTSDKYLHLYESPWDVFSLFEDVNDVIIYETGISALTINHNMYRSYKVRPPNFTVTNVWSDPENTIDDEGNTTPTTYGEEQHPFTGDLTQTGAGYKTGSKTTELHLECSGMGLGTLESLYIYINGYLQVHTHLVSGDPEVSGTVAFYDISYGSPGHELLSLDQVGEGTNTQTQTERNIEITTDWQTTYTMPEKIIIQGKTSIGYYGGDSGDEGRVDSTMKIYDVSLIIINILDFINEPDASYKILDDLKYLYSASNGFIGGYTDAGGFLADKVYRAHRDMMYRYAGVDFDNDYMLNWTALTSARANWDIRIWILEPVPLKETLEQLQYEGGFIFMLVADSDGTGTPGGKYIWVENSYDGGDVAFTLQNEDYNNLEISMSDFSEIVTQRTYNYNRHPADDRYINSTTYTNSGARTEYNVGTLENIEEINLDYLVDAVNEGSTPNACIARYYDNIIANPKIHISCEIKNPKIFAIEVGDKIKFNDSNILPFAKAWADLYFMVIETRRTKEYVSIIAREVYEA